MVVAWTSCHGGLPPAYRYGTLGCTVAEMRIRRADCCHLGHGTTIAMGIGVPKQVLPPARTLCRRWCRAAPWPGLLGVSRGRMPSQKAYAGDVEAWRHTRLTMMHGVDMLEIAQQRVHQVACGIIILMGTDIFFSSDSAVPALPATPINYETQCDGRGDRLR